MSGLFKKKETAIKIKDKVWMTGKAKLGAFINELKKNPDSVFIFWFDESLRQTESFFANQSIPVATLLMAREANTSRVFDKKIVFAEHYPLEEEEIELFQKL